MQTISTLKAFQVFLIGIGLLLITLSTYIHFNVQELKTSWKHTPANLEFAYIQNRSSPARGAWGKDVAILKYNYLVLGKQYTNNRLMPLDFIFISRDKVDSLEQGKINIFYNPQKPQESFIFIEYPLVALSLMFLAGVASSFIGIFLGRIIKALLSLAYKF
ncbi:DUF3592 domain-containing protein [Halioxenophilus sp. WMMB6]|uniref:DUF3592 domain-containing protein n=1 Tax=Halioxenophilus sp. WMMB6 TaxID=3073815 RepID=UPI00295E32ED|nr:DUF3592 domain-containing protein [Halioxenophilus sp. WMMB6]